MLLAQLENLKGLAKRKKEVEGHSRTADAFRTRQQNLVELANTLAPYAGALEAYRRRGLATYNAEGKSEALMLRVQKALAQFRESETSILDSAVFNYTEFKSAVYGERDRLDKHLKEAWRVYLAAHKSPATRNILDLLGKLEGFKCAVETIRDRDEKLKADKPPLSEADFTRYEGYLADMRTAWSTLKSADLDEEVETFLRALGPKGAPIALLTPRVLEWMTKNQVETSFCVQVLG